jgi:hypothetical protein
MGLFKGNQVVSIYPLSFFYEHGLKQYFQGASAYYLYKYSCQPANRRFAGEIK